jgi:hypothetical protein
MLTDGGQSGFNRRDFKHDDKPFAFVFFAITMRPAVTAFGFGVSLQIENFNLALPDGLAARVFMDTHGLVPNRAATVQLHYRRFEAGYVIPFFQHNL